MYQLDQNCLYHKPPTISKYMDTKVWSIIFALIIIIILSAEIKKIL